MYYVCTYMRTTSLPLVVIAGPIKPRDISPNASFQILFLLPSQVPGNGSPASYLDQAHKEKALQSMQQMSSAQIVSASAMHSKSIGLPPGVPYPPVTHGGFWQPGIQQMTQE